MSEMRLDIIARGDIEIIREWRNGDLQSMRTSFPLTSEMQQKFYIEISCNRQTNNRYFSVIATNLIGMIGIENISWENRIGELSCVFKPSLSQETKIEALNLLFKYGFDKLNLENIFGEVYNCNPDFLFWKYAINIYNGYTTSLQNRKYFNGKYWDSMYFNINKERCFK